MSVIQSGRYCIAHGAEMDYYLGIYTCKNKVHWTEWFLAKRPPPDKNSKSGIFLSFKKMWTKFGKIFQNRTFVSISSTGLLGVDENMAFLKNSFLGLQKPSHPI